LFEELISCGGILLIKNLMLLTLIFMAGIALVGCSNSTEHSYAAILLVNGKEYIWQGDMESNEFTIDDKIGEVKKSVDAKVYPTDDFSSNFLKVGEEIYTSNEEAKVIIVKREDGSYDKFTEEGYSKDEE